MGAHRHLVQVASVPFRDAMKFAMDAGNGFREVAEHSSAGEFEDASASLEKVLTTCAGCHTAHREKAEDGSWKIK